MSLRSKIIRLAHQKPELREHLLPLITKSARGIDPFLDSNLTYPDWSPMSWNKLVGSVDFKAGPHFYGKVDKMNPHTGKSFSLDKITSATVYVDHSRGETELKNYKRGQFPKFVSQWLKKDPKWEIYSISINWYGEFSEARALLTERGHFIEDSSKLLKSRMFEWHKGGLADPNPEYIEYMTEKGEHYLSFFTGTDDDEIWPALKNLRDIMVGDGVPLSAKEFFEDMEEQYDELYEAAEERENNWD